MPDTSFHEPETRPTPMPGAKPSAPQANTGDPRAATDKSKPAPAPQKDTGDKDRANSLHDHIAAYFAPKEARTGPEGKTVNDVVDEAVAGAKGANPDY